MVSMETNDINAELTRLGVVTKGKNKATKQELLHQAYIKDLPSRIAKEYKQYRPKPEGGGRPEDREESELSKGGEEQ